MKSDYMAPDKYNKLFVFMTYENVLAVRVSLETGLRIGDVVKIKPSDIRGRTLTFTAKKTGKKGKAVITQDLANRLRQISGDKYVFPKRGKPDEHRTRQTVWKDVKKAAAALRSVGVIEPGDNVTPHSARKTFAVEDSERYGLNHTQKALQHRDKRTTRMYAFSDRVVKEYDNAYEIKRIGDKVDKLELLMTQIIEKLA